jgi:hypothetical protein
MASKEKIRIQRDTTLYHDPGMRDRVLSILSNYDPRYLRVALEVLYDQVFTINGSVDAYLQNFLTEVLLTL